MDRKSKILCFSESLERDLSNGTIKVDIREIKVFANLAITMDPIIMEAIPWPMVQGRKMTN